MRLERIMRRMAQHLLVRSWLRNCWGENGMKNVFDNVERRCDARDSGNDSATLNIGKASV